MHISLKKFAKRLVLSSLLAVGMLGVGVSTADARLRETIFVGTDSAGCTHWASFGSSAGYFTYKCCGGGCSET